MDSRQFKWDAARRIPSHCLKWAQDILESEITYAIKMSNSH